MEKPIDEGWLHWRKLQMSMVGETKGIGLGWLVQRVGQAIQDQGGAGNEAGA